VTVTIAASQHHVRVAAAAASPELANALHRGADELRDALGKHGLTLSELSANTQQQEAPARERPDAERGTRNQPGRAPAPAATSEPETPRPARPGVRVLA
jgi:hypothetical protein